MTDFTQLHQTYLTIVGQDCLAHDTKKAMIEQLVVGEMPGAGWHVKGITQAALDAYAANGYKPGPKIQRGHLVRRHDTYNTLVANPILDAQEWYDFIIEHTTTYLCTKEENGVDGTEHWTEMFEFDNAPEWLFENQKVGFKHRVAEREWLREWHAARLAA